MLAELAHADPHHVELLEVIGRLDSDKVRRVTQALNQAVENGRTHVILELSRVEYINSMGLRELFHAMRRIQGAGIKLYLTNPTERVQTLLELVGLDSIFNIYTDSDWDLTKLPMAHRSALYHQTYYC